MTVFNATFVQAVSSLETITTSPELLYLSAVKILILTKFKGNIGVAFAGDNSQVDTCQETSLSVKFKLKSF